jgi:hypothetical protein
MGEGSVQYANHGKAIVETRLEIRRWREEQKDNSATGRTI